MDKEVKKELLHILEFIARYEIIHDYLGPENAAKYAMSLPDEDKEIFKTYFKLTEFEEEALLELESMISNRK